MKKLFFACLVSFLLPHAARAQAILNIPVTASDQATMVFVDFEPQDRDAGKGYSGWLTTQAGGRVLLICESGSNYIKAAPAFNNVPEAGYYEFESQDKCGTIARSMISHPGRPVQFTMTINPTRAASPGYVGGDITAIEWLGGNK